MVAALRLAALAILGLLLTPAQADIVHGSKRDAVLKELGKPASTAQRGSREILQYPKGIRIELEQGVVVDIRGYSAEVVTPTEPVAAAALPPSTPAVTKTPAAPANPDYSPAASANALGDEVAKMDTAWGARPPNPLQQKPTNWLELVVGLVLRFGFTLLALRLAFKYWEMDALWSGTLAIAAIDIAVHAVLELLGPVTSGFTTISGVENTVPALLMIFTIQHFCFNKRLQNALLTASAVKGIVMILKIFIFVLLLRVLFG